MDYAAMILSFPPPFEELRKRRGQKLDLIGEGIVTERRNAGINTPVKISHLAFLFITRYVYRITKAITVLSKIESDVHKGYAKQRCKTINPYNKALQICSKKHNIQPPHFQKNKKKQYKNPTTSTPSSS